MGTPTLESTADITSLSQHSKSQRLDLRILSALFPGIHIHLIIVPSKPQRRWFLLAPSGPGIRVLSGTWEELKDKGVPDSLVCWCEILEGLRNLAQMPPV